MVIGSVWRQAEVDTRPDHQKSRHPHGAAAWRKHDLLRALVDALSGFGLHGFDFDFVLFGRGGKEPRTRWACQSVAFMISVVVAPLAVQSVPGSWRPGSGRGGLGFALGGFLTLGHPCSGWPLSSRKPSPARLSRSVGD